VADQRPSVGLLHWKELPFDISPEILIHETKSRRAVYGRCHDPPTASRYARIVGGRGWHSESLTLILIFDGIDHRWDMHRVQTHEVVSAEELFEVELGQAPSLMRRNSPGRILSRFGGRESARAFAHAFAVRNGSPHERKDERNNS
jgi:hypothetical protein